MKAKDVEVTPVNEEYVQHYRKVKNQLLANHFQCLLGQQPSSLPYFLLKRHLNREFLDSLCFVFTFHKLPLRFKTNENAAFDAPDSCVLFTSYAIQVLEINHSKVGDQGAQVLAQITSLTRLSLSLSELTDSGAQILTTLPHLQSLGAGINLFTERGIKLLLGMRTLTELDLSHNQRPNGKYTKPYFPVTADYGASFKENTTLKLLVLRENHITAEFTSLLTYNTSVTALDLECCAIDDAAVNPLATMTNLLLLNLRGNKLSPLGLAALANHPRLHYLSLDNSNHNVCPAPQLFSNHPTLTDLSLNHNDIDYDTALAYAENTRLRSLWFHGNGRLSDRNELKLNYQKNSTLTELHLGIKDYPPRPLTVEGNKKHMLKIRSEFVRRLIMIASLITKQNAPQSILQRLPKELRIYILQSIYSCDDLHLPPNQAKQLVEYIIEHIAMIDQLVKQREPLKFYRDGVSRGADKLHTYMFYSIPKLRA